MSVDPLSFLTSEIKSDELEKINKEEEIKKEEEKNVEKKEEKKEEKEKKDDKKGGEKGISELRKQRDQLKEEKEKLEKELNELSKFKSTSKIYEYIEKKYGKVDDETIDEFINKNKKRKSEVEELQKKEKELDGRIKELNITSSNEWQKEYVIPLRKADESLTALIADVDSSGKIRHPELFQSLKVKLVELDNGKPKDAIRIKAILKSFATEYEKKTGEVYEVPDIKSITNAVEDVHGRFSSMISAKKNWDEVTQKRRKEIEFEESEKRKKFLEKELDGREYLSRKVKKELTGQKELVDIFDEEFIDKNITDSHIKFTKILKGEEDQFGYDYALSAFSKARMFDALLDKYNELKKHVKDEEGLSSGSRRSIDTEKKPERKVGERPLDFLSE